MNPSMNQTTKTTIQIIYQSYIYFFYQNMAANKNSIPTLSTIFLKKHSTTLYNYCIYIYILYALYQKTTKSTNQRPTQQTSKHHPPPGPTRSPTISIEAHRSHLSLRIRGDAHVAEVGKGLHPQGERNMPKNQGG